MGAKKEIRTRKARWNELARQAGGGKDRSKARQKPQRKRVKKHG